MEKQNTPSDHEAQQSLKTPTKLENQQEMKLEEGKESSTPDQSTVEMKSQGPSTSMKGGVNQSQIQQAPVQDAPPGLCRCLIV
mmetsp:Transcript_10975/g.21499  ORF Transcript_10975/g.21499 Transcript_10975/m.21499 type:complete len:83 (+) Transcript_10975:2068-2316(+)